jgi:hypothetical protein
MTEKNLATFLASLADADVRRLAWAIGSPSLFEASNSAWQGKLRSDAWSESELARCTEWLRALDAKPDALHAALGDPTVATPLGHTFEKYVLFWQAARPDVRAASRGLVVRSGNRTVGEFDVVLLRHDGVIETLEVTVKYYLNLRPELGINGCIGPRAFDRMADKYAKMTTRQTDLGHTDAGRIALCRWLETECGEQRDPESLVVENYALARGYVFHATADAAIPIELSSAHGRGLWQTDETALPDIAPDAWRQLGGREWLGPYRGVTSASGWPVDAAMPLMMARMVPDGTMSQEVERRFVVRAESGLLKAV